MINKPENTTPPSNEDVPRVGGEDDSRAFDSDFRAGYDEDSREVVNDQSPSSTVVEKR